MLGVRHRFSQKELRNALSSTDKQFMNANSSENSHKEGTEPSTYLVRSVATRILSGIYRLLALVVILLISFAAIYTIALFIPGLSVSGVGVYDCPSAFSNPKPIFNQQFDRDMAKLGQRIRDDYAEINHNSEKILEEYPRDNETTSLKRLTALKSLFLDDLKNITEFRTDESSLETYRKLDMNICASDRIDIDRNIIRTRSEPLYQYGMDSTGDPNIATAMPDYSDYRDPFQHFLTAQSVLILWGIAIISIAALVLIRKKITPFQRTHKWVRRTTAGVVIVALIIVTVTPLVSGLYTEDGESCRAYNVFDIRKSPSEKPGDGLSNIRKVLTISSQDALTRLEKEQKTTSSNEEKARFKKDHDKIRVQALDLFKQLDKTEIGRNTVANRGKATSDCVASTRLVVLTSGFGLLNLLGFIIFIRGKKSTMPTKLIID